MSTVAESRNSPVLFTLALGPTKMACEYGCAGIRSADVFGSELLGAICQKYVTVVCEQSTVMPPKSIPSLHGSVVKPRSSRIEAGDCGNLIVTLAYCAAT